MPSHLFRFLASFLLVVLVRSQDVTSLQAQIDPDQVAIRVETVRGGVHMVSGAGGNLAVFVGENGVLMVDSDYAELSGPILTTVRGLAEDAGGNPSLRYVVNTHWHFDHTGGNGPMAQAGAVLIAHENVDRMMAEDRVLAGLGGREVPAAPAEARPTVTFNDRMNLSWNGELIHLVHMPAAHSSGDVIVHFRDADVIHLGDLFFNGMYPYIDVDFGGDIRGMVRALEEVLAHTDETTLFIPGHGPLGKRADLRAYCEMLRAVRDRLEVMIAEGRTRDEAVAAHPTADLDADWAGEGSFMLPDVWVGLVYDGMIRSGGTQD
jgi:glyoxylase-like metal-dependent hydrolase (beta-lactamase superfamily II)